MKYFNYSNNFLHIHAYIYNTVSIINSILLINIKIFLILIIIYRYCIINICMYMKEIIAIIKVFHIQLYLYTIYPIIYILLLNVPRTCINNYK